MLKGLTLYRSAVAYLFECGFIVQDVVGDLAQFFKVFDGQDNHVTYRDGQSIV